MKMQAIACFAAAALAAGNVRAQGYAPDVQRLPDQALDPYADEQMPPSPPPEYLTIDADSYDEDGYDADYDVYYDTVASENYDDGYDPQAYQQFQSALDPYGQWVEDPNYGEVWAPSVEVVGGDFTPYATGGHWVLTEYGWTWVSDWDWGWGPFHYGRWVDLVGYGWCWVPGSIWGPGWVSWRYGGGYAGWAPLPPRGVTVGPPRGVRSPWRFVLAHQLGDRRANYLPRHVVPAVFAKTSVVTNLHTTNGNRFNAGPSPSLVRAVARPVPLQQAAPRAMPHPSVVAHAGVPVQSRPWYHTPSYQAPYRAPAYRAPAYRPPSSIPLHSDYSNPRTVVLGNQPRPMNGTLTVVRPPAPQPAYHSGESLPAYHAVVPAPSYHYSAPAPSYSAPAPAYHYSAPAPSYSAPAPSYHYSAPAPAYSAPAPAPVYHAPTSYSAPAPSYHYSAPAPSHFTGGGHHH
jgi:hypothetical protein